MQNGINAQQTADSLSLLRDTHNVIAALPADDAVSAVRQITDALATVNRAEGVTLEERYDDICLLETATIDRTRALLREYLTTSRQMIQRESALWNGAYTCWRELGVAYAICVQQYVDDAAAVAGFQKPARAAVARALRALRRQLQWLRLRYATAPLQLWAELARLYAHVEGDGVDDDMLIYPGDNTTLQREFLNTLMLAALPCENLDPREQDLATYIVHRYVPQFVISTTPVAGCTHVFDLNNPRAPVRIDSALQPAAGMRFFGAGPAIDAFDAALHVMAQTGQLPAELDFKYPIELDFLTPVLQQIYLDWAGKTPERRHEREKSNARVTVVPGFRECFNVLEQAAADPFDFTAIDIGESWVASDVSTDGFGVVIPALSGDWVSVGSVAGIQSDAGGDWSVGMVRRVRRLADGQQHIGMQVLSHTAMAVRVMRDASAGRNMRVTQRMPVDRALLLTADAARQEEIELLVSDAGLYGEGDMHVLAGDSVLLVRLLEVIETTVTCARIRFAVIGIES